MEKKLRPYATYFRTVFDRLSSVIFGVSNEEKPKSIRVVRKKADMQFSYNQYSNMFAGVWKRSPHEEEFWNIVVRVAWLITLIETNEDASNSLRGIDDEERSRIIRSWIGMR